MKYIPFSFSESEESIAKVANSANQDPKPLEVSNFSGISKGEFENQKLPEAQSSGSELPEPIKPSRCWAEAIAKAQHLDHTRKYVLRVIWPTDTTKELARFVEPGRLSHALEVLCNHYPLADGVVVCCPTTGPNGKPDLEPVLAVGLWLNSEES